MPSVYPGVIDSFEQIPAKLSGEPNHTIVHQKLHDVILAIENALGVNPGDRITAASTLASQASAKASTAQTTADAANLSANSAKSTANAAQTAANTAQATANTATNTANTAQGTANAAQSTATTANSTATTAYNTASNAWILASGANSRLQCKHQIVTCGSSGVGVLTLPASMGSTNWGIMLNPIVSVSGDVFVARAGGNPLNNTQIHVVVHKNGAPFAGGIGIYYIAYKND